MTSSAIEPLHSCDSRYGQSRHKIIIITIIVIIIIILSRVIGLFFLVLFIMNQRGCPPYRLKFQTALLSVLCVSVSCREPTAWFPDIPNFSLNLLLLFRWPKSLPVWTYTYFMSDIRYISIHKLLYLIYFLLPLAWYSYPLELPHLSARMLSIFVFN